MEKSMETQVQQLFPFLQGGNLSIKEVPKGTVIFDEGDTCGGVPFLLKGTVRVSKVGKNGREVRLYRVTTGETCILTVSSILSGHVYPAIAMTEEDVVAAILPYDIFKELMGKDQDLQQYIYQLLTERLQEVLMMIDEVIFRRMDERVIQFLLEHSGENNNVIHMTHELIAAELGSAREVISRILKQLEKEALIQLSRGKIRVIQRTKLQEKLSD